MTDSNKPTILIVDDERNTRDVLSRFLRMKYDVTIAEDGIRGCNVLKRNDFDLVLTDLRMPGTGGLEVLKTALGRKNKPPCIVFTAYGSVETAVEAMKAGAFDFVSKPVNFDRLEILIERAMESRRLKEENHQLRQKLQNRSATDNVIGKSALIEEVMETVAQVAPSRATVLVAGDSGTGKELIAHALHNKSGREGKFIAVHCAALPPNLLESELFGHEKGAFTGAVEQKKGRFELADNGTLFLDEIGEIDMQIQVKLLRALETRNFERVGGIETIYTDTRVVAATNRDLKAMVEEGTFREDLFFRLDVINIRLPGLKERQEDVPLLAKHFLGEFNSDNGKDIESISEEAISILCNYEWPGNIRELKNCIERMVVLSRNKVLQVDDVPVHIREKSNPGLTRKIFTPNSLELDKNEKMLIIKALDECNGNRTKAAEKLGISRRTLHRKLHTYDIS